jgi:eukaryotic-like serine/threonine-protein kinase
MRNDWKKLEGQVVNKMFPLRRFLGSTSHSAVFLTQSGHAQPKNLAIKFISAGAKADSQISLLQSASKLNHPNLLSLLPGGRCQLAGMDLVFVVMEYAEADVGRVLRERALTTNETRELLGPLLDALNFIHSKGLVHAHIKPSNIMAVGNQVKLSSDTVLPLGEPRPASRPVDIYDAPESRTALIAGSSDVWSLGVTLVEMLTQRTPASPQESQADPLVPPTLPQPFLDIARQCLRRDPLLRWTTAQIADCLGPVPVTTAAQEVTVGAEKRASAPVASSEATSSAKKPAPALVAAPLATGGAAKEVESTTGAWQDVHYYWVVLCKNYFFHMRQNLFFRHRIPLAATDPFSPVPSLDGPFKVRCDDCGKTYTYKRSDVRRYEQEITKAFTPHPLFR